MATLLVGATLITQAWHQPAVHQRPSLLLSTSSVIRKPYQVRCSANDDEAAASRMLFDTIGADQRPGLLASLEPRDALTIAFLSHGTFVSTMNVVGNYEGCALQHLEPLHLVRMRL